MNRLYTMLRLLLKRGYKQMISCETKEIFDIETYMTYLNENEDIEGDLKQIILSPKEIFIGMFIDNNFCPMFQVIV